MAKCPNCGEEVERPDKPLRNTFFLFDTYTCDNCSTNFSVPKFNSTQTGIKHSAMANG